MNRFKLLAAAMLLALPIISACGEDPPAPPPTGTIDGLVSIEGQGLDGVSVTLSNGAVTTTANGGMFRFDGVEAGAYTVTISNFPDDATFNNTSSPATIASDGETVTINFPGTWIRTSAIMGTVTVENEGLSGVTVKLTGMSDSETLTDANGQYAFTGLRKGNYTVEISGFDEDDVAFGSTASTADLAVGESKVIPFEGTYLRTSAITGQVSVENVGLADVTVSLQGRDEERTATTNSAGQYTFSELRSGDYSVGITNPDPDDYGFDVTSKNLTIAHGETGSVSFDGILLRTASIMGTVTVEGVGGIEGVKVSVQGEGAELEKMTNAAGQFSFTELHAGDYSIGITGFDDDLYGFDVTTATVTVALQETATVPFSGIELRTAGIEGTITVEDHPIPGVTVTVTGGPKDEEHTRVTNDAGYYLVDRLHAGTYTITISDFDANEYEFVATSTTTDVGLRTTATVAFQGDLLRTAGISGRVSVEDPDMPLDGVTVTLSGDADATMMTADGGQYAFTGLAAGDYNVAISGWDEVKYDFSDTPTDVDLEVMQDSAEVQNFVGKHQKNASVSGQLFIDEVMSDGMLTDGEPPFARAGIPLLLQGPGVGEVSAGFTGADGSYSFDSLISGTYRVLVDLNEQVIDSLTAHGFRYAGETTGHVVTLDAGEEETANFPIRIVMQTIHVGAVMGTSEMATETMVGGVELMLYPTVEDADAGTNALGKAKTGADDTKPNYGMATFHFPRAMDLGPGGQGLDHLVFAKFVSSDNKALEVADNSHIEIQYAGIDRVSAAPAAARLLNTAVSFQWWVKSKADVPNGDRFLGGWNVVLGDTTIATGDSAAADRTMRASAADHGKASFSGRVMIADLDDMAQAKYTVMLDMDSDGPPAHDAMQPDGGEMWKSSGSLTHTHNALMMPPKETADVGPLYVTWTTQSLVVGVYRERDDVEGFVGHTSHRVEDDRRPHADVAKEMVVEVMYRNDRNRLEKLEWYDHDDDPTTDPIHPTLTVGANGLVTAMHLPAMTELTVRLDVGLNRVAVTEPREYVETFGQDLDLGMTVGAFGDMSGGGPEVRLCTSSIGTSSDDGDCATFGYQWTTGTVTGSTSPAVRGLPVTLEAVTDNHGARNQDGTTASSGRKSFSVRDGTYDMSLSADGNVNWSISPTSPETQRVWCYHDEHADETDEPRADSAWVGRACTGATSASWRLTQQNLEIRGYVANVDHEYNSVVRGDETYEGAELEIHLAGTGTTRNGIPPKGRKLDQTATVQADGSYKFTDLAAGRYVITAVGTADYEGLQSNPRDNVAGPATADDDYVDVDEQQAGLALPYWNYMNSTAMNTTNSVTVGTGPNAPSFIFHNFALLHKDGTFSGAVREASGRHGAVAVELRRCLVYTPADTVGPGAEDDIAETCSDDTAFGPQVKQTASSGSWSFAGLREGYYQVNIAATGYNRAKWNATDGIDDDAADCEGSAGAFDAAQTCDTERTVRKFDLLKGKTAFNRNRAVYNIYNSNLSSGDAATAVAVTGVTSNGADPVDLASAFTPIQDPQPAGEEAMGATSAAVTYDAASIRVSATVPATASYVIINGTALGDPSYTPSTSALNPGADVPLTHNRTAVGIGPNTNADTNPTAAPANDITIRVTAQNGYNDHDYNFTATRANPVGNQLEADEVQYASTNAQSGDGSSGTPFLVVTASATANTVVVTFDLEELPGATSIDTKCAQSVAVWAPGATSAMKAASDGDADFCSGEQYTLTAGTTGTTYRVIITSEDNRAWTYYVNVSRGA